MTAAAKDKTGVILNTSQPGPAGVYRRGKNFIVTTGALMPALCIKCGQYATTPLVMRFSWSSPWVSLVALAGPLIHYGVARATARSTTLSIYVCEEHLTRRSLYRKNAAILLISGIPAMILLTIFLPEHIWWDLVIGILLLLFGGVFLDRADNGIIPHVKFITDRFATFRGGGEDFLSGLPVAPPELS